MVAHPRVKGFTLIELLIAITVMSLVIGISTYAFSLFTRNWGGQTGSFDRAAGQLQRVELLGRVIRDAVAWLVIDERDKQNPGFYFLGRDEGMTFVTESPIFNPRGLAVVRVFREREESSQTWRLVYEEAPLDGVILRRASQILPFQHRLVVLQGLRSLDFQYFGWDSLAARVGNDEQTPGGPQWFTEFDGIRRQQQPSKIALRLDQANVSFDLAERDEVIFGRAMSTE